MRFIQIHELVSYPASNLNRDDIGRPKTVKIGDSTRLRISSQSLKRAWRTSDIMKDSFPEMGIRTRSLSKEMEKAMVKGISLIDLISGNEVVTRKPIDKGLAEKLSIDIDDAFRSKKSALDDGGDSSDKQESDVSKNEKNTKNLKEDKSQKKKQLLHYTPAELRAADEIMLKASNGEEFKIENLLCNYEFPVDIAMFGRMVAHDNTYDCEAAVQVAHSFTVHKAVIEDDYFTAVDDLSGDDNGAGHVDVAGFGAGLFYNYICVDFDLLSKNIGSEDKAKDALKVLVKASATIPPSGKQNAFASRAYASYILVEKGNEQPRSLSSAFMKPIRGDDILGEATKAMRDAECAFDAAFGKCYDSKYEIDVFAHSGTMDGLLEFLDE